MKSGHKYAEMISPPYGSSDIRIAGAGFGLIISAYRRSARSAYYTFLPRITFTRTTITAITRRTWINPPSVVDVTRPSIHNTTRITASVQSIFYTPFRERHPAPDGHMPVLFAMMSSDSYPLLELLRITGFSYSLKEQHACSITWY